ncbi:MAG: hypothetical protein ACRD1K_19700 [Acidimicrobiales bacterium]
MGQGAHYLGDEERVAIGLAVDGTDRGGRRADRHGGLDETTDVVLGEASEFDSPPSPAQPTQGVEEAMIATQVPVTVGTDDEYGHRG